MPRKGHTAFVVISELRFPYLVYCNVLNRLNEVCFSQSQCHSIKHCTQAWGKYCIMFSTQVGNKKTQKNRVINCPHTVTKCHQEPMLSLTWHLIICLESDSWQAPPSEPLVWLCCVSSHQPRYRRRQKPCVAKVSSLRAAAVLVLLMYSLPIKSVTVNYCNYEGELPSNLSFDGDTARAVALLQWPLESAPVVSWQQTGCRVRPENTWQWWREGDCTVHLG